MVTKESHPVTWAELMYDLEDAHEELGALLSDLAASNDQDETDFRIRLAHIYAHLNRAWHIRDFTDAQSTPDWPAATGFPRDIVPL